MRVFQAAWFGILFLLSPRARQARQHVRQLSASAKPSTTVCGPDAILTVFREMCDSRAVRMCHSGAQPGLYRFQVGIKMNK